MAYDQRSPISVDRFKPAFSRLKIGVYHDPPPARAATPSIRTLAWSPLGNNVATGASDRKLRVWNPERPNVKQSTELRGHTSSIEKVVFNPMREAELASCSSDGSVRVWDVRSRTCTMEVKPTVGNAGVQFFQVCWTPDGKDLLAGTKTDRLYRISRETGTIISEHQQEVQTNHVAFSWGSKDLFLTGGDGTLKMLDYPSMTERRSFRAHTSSAYCVDVSPDGRYIGIGGTDALVTLWDTTNFFCKRSISRLTGPIRCVSFSWEGGYVLATTDEDRGVEISHVDTGDVVHKIDVGCAPVAQWSPKDYSIAFALQEGTQSGLRIVNAASLV